MIFMRFDQSILHTVNLVLLLHKPHNIHLDKYLQTNFYGKFGMIVVQFGLVIWIVPTIGQHCCATRDGILLQRL